MTFDYGPIIATAQRLLRDFGREITITVLGARDADNPLTEARAAPVSFTIRAVWVEKPLRVSSEIELQGGALLVSAADVPAGVDLSAAIQITDDGVTRKVQQAQPVKPGGQAIIWGVRLDDRIRSV